MSSLQRFLMVVGIALALLAGAVASSSAQALRSVETTGAANGSATLTSQAARTQDAGRTPVSKLKPRMKRKYIAFPKKRLRQTARYSKRHYGKRRYQLTNPRVIVEHYTDGPSMMSAWWTMANNSKNLGESPGVCAHFIINKKGRIFRVVPLGIRCRHTIGLNQKSIGIEHVGYSSRSVFRHKQQRRASYQLTLWLMGRYDIPVRNVIGHGESLHSPLRHERYKSWRCLTHVDFRRQAMKRYRHALRVRARDHGLRIGAAPKWVDPC